MFWFSCQYDCSQQTSLYHTNRLIICFAAVLLITTFIECHVKILCRSSLRIEFPYFLLPQREKEVVCRTILRCLVLLSYFEPTLATEIQVIFVCNEKNPDCHNKDDQAGKKVEYPSWTTETIAKVGSTRTRG